MKGLKNRPSGGASEIRTTRSSAVASETKTISFANGNGAPPWHDTTTSAGSRDGSSIRREVSPFVDLPPNVFSPGGRLYDIEDAVHAVSSVHDPSSTTLVVIQCRDGIVAVTTLPQSPYLQYETATSKFKDDTILLSNKCNSSNNEDLEYNVSSLLRLDDDNEWGMDQYTTVPPFGRLQWPRRPPHKVYNTRNDDFSTLTTTDNSSHLNTASTTTTAATTTATTTDDDSVSSVYDHGRIVLSISAGNAVESQILRHRIYQTAERLRSSSSTSEICPTEAFAMILARTLADQNQQRTQVLGNGRIVAATAVIIDICSSENKNHATAAATKLYRIDPAGQFWICQAVVAGRYARIIQQNLYDSMLKYQTAATTPTSSSSSLGSSNDPSNPVCMPSTLLRQQVCTLLSNLTIDEALKMATQCMIDGMNNRRHVPWNHDQQQHMEPIRIRGISISKTNLSVRNYSQRNLLSLVRTAQQ
jgi:20S proteasome alpha/beta subunit